MTFANHLWRNMQKRKLASRLSSAIAAIALMSSVSVAVAQNADRPWMNRVLSPEERAELVLKQMTLEEKLALLHGNGMARSPQWTMPLTDRAHDGARYGEGVP